MNDYMRIIPNIRIIIDYTKQTTKKALIWEFWDCMVKEL